MVSDRQELGEYWRMRVMSTGEAYVCVITQHERMVEELGQTASADGAFAIASARRAEALAFNELAHTLRAYADFGYKGTPPPDDDERLIC